MRVLDAKRQGQLAKLLKDGEFLFVAVSFLVFVTAFWSAKDWYLTARLFPWFATIPGSILCAVQLWRYATGWEQTNEVGAMAVDEVYEALESPEVEHRRQLEFWVWIVLTALAIFLLGMNFALPISMALFVRLAGRESWFFCLTMGVGIFVIVWGFFEWGFGMTWPIGELFYWLHIKVL